MPNSFLGENFLLDSHPALILYHEYAAGMPIFDYHSHLPVEQITTDRRFENITQLWLYGDHYKWRAMRACGVGEELVSGKPIPADDYERFEAWAEVVPQTIGNPLYHWTHMELKRYFGITKPLSKKTAREIYDTCSQILETPEMSARSIIRKSNVKVLCTTDDPVDDLTGHLQMRKENWGTRVFPTWRPDRAFHAGDARNFNIWVDDLQRSAHTDIRTYDDFVSALQERHDHFHDAGCRLSDYGLERPYVFDFTERALTAAFARVRAGKDLVGDELEIYRSGILHRLLCMDAESDWTQQLHFAARRNNNSRKFISLGPDSGYDSIGDFEIGEGLVRLLDRLEYGGKLGRTIIYTLNPRDNDMIASVIEAFMDGKTPGKIQFGSAWWFNDHKAGIERQLETLASIALLSRFIGMLTDSRSFLSYPRHEYFRRILCNLLGRWIERGELPEDYEFLGNVVQDICYRNAVNYFRLTLD